MLRTLTVHKLYAKLKKCDFWMEKVHFLGHVISEEGILVDPAKVAEVEKSGLDLSMFSKYKAS